MPPLRKKGRGGGGGKTEAPFPGEVPGTSPSVSASLVRKEREKKITSSSLGIENLGVFVSRSFQKERGEKKLLEASRTSLHLTSGTFGKSARARKPEPTSTDTTPRVTDVGGRREDRERRLTESAQRASNAAAYRSACRGREEPAVCRTSCRELGDEKVLYRRSVRAGEEKLVRRVGRRDDKSAEYSTRYNSIYPGVSSGAGKGVRESQSVDGGPLKSSGGLLSQRIERGDEMNLVRASPISPPLLLRKSPRAADSGTAANSPGMSLPVKSSCKCGAFRSSSDTGSSPGLMGVDDRRRVPSPIPPPLSVDLLGREKKSRELMESPLRSGAHNSASASRASTPNFLQGRLALLEGRVSQIAAELKATKDLLDANNPACSKAVLTDIQLKITGIEKAINYRLARECGLVDQLEAEQRKGTYIQANDVAQGRNLLEGKKKSSGRASKSSSEIVPHGQGLYGKPSKSAQSSRALTLSSSTLAYDGGAAEQLSHIASLAAPRSRGPAIFQCVEVGGSAPASQVKSVFDQDEFEERLFPHQKLLRNRPSVHQKLLENRAALHQKLVENSILLRNKLAALEERDGVNLDSGDLGAAEFISSLKQVGHGALRSDRDFSRGKAVKGDPGSSRALRMCIGGNSFPQGSHCGYMEYDGDMSSAKERPSSRERRRSSGSRKSFSGTPLDPKNDLVFHPLERGSSGNGRRRRSSEKRKSISTSESCSPEPVHGASQIVMLEPAVKLAVPSPLPALTALDPAPNESTLELECTEDDLVFPDDSVVHGGEGGLWMGGATEKDGEKSVEVSGSPCSEDPADDLQEALNPVNNEYDEQEEDGSSGERLHQIGDKIATAGWFISEGEGILLAHDDTSCSFYDAANMEGKATFKGPKLSPGAWRDCWLVRAAGHDGASNKYVVAASAGSAGDSAFCSWDFYERRITAFRCETPEPQPSPGSFSFQSSASNSPDHRRFHSKDRSKAPSFSWYSGSENAQLLKGRTPSGALSLDSISGGSCPSDTENLGVPLWWYRPCSPLIASAGTGLKTVTLFDVRDGAVVMKWDLGRWVASMEFSSPIQWRNKGKIVLAEDQSISLWDVNTMTPQRLHSISLNGKDLRAMHVRNSDAEFSGGVRQRVSSRDNQTGDGVLCTHDAVNVLDFRVPAGIALKIPTFGETAHSVCTNGDSVFAGVTVSNKVVNSGSVKGNVQCKVNEWSIKMGRPMSMFKFPASSAHLMHQSVAQVWGTSDIVMGVNGNGLFMYDALKEGLPGRDGGPSAREVLGTDDLVQPTFDLAGNRALLISRDRPASWAHCP